MYLLITESIRRKLRFVNMELKMLNMGVRIPTTKLPDGGQESNGV